MQKKMPELRNYQKDDVQKLITHPAMGVFNEQRTGKTPTALMTMRNHNVNKLLIVCPASAQYQWAAECLTWLGINAEIIKGTPAHRERMLHNWTSGPVIISYDLLKTTARSGGCIDLVLARKPDGVILDEVHRIKNHKSAAAKTAFKLIKTPYRLALSGTPCPNKPEEIYSTLHFLRPEQFKSYWPFIEEYFYVATSFGTHGAYKDILSFKPYKEKQLQMLLHDISIQRKRKDVMPWLPDKDRQDILLPLTATQTKQLDELSKYFEVGDVVTQTILDRLLRYRQICLHPALIGLPGASPKTEWLIQRVKDYPDESIIIFSKFTSYINMLSELLPDCRTIVGATAIKQRADYVSDFQAGKIKTLIINIDAGKEALTLDRATTVIFTDQYPPAADIQQAEDRFVATTEQKKDKAHTIIRLIMKGSYDEQLCELVNQRATAIDVINDYNKYLKQKGGH